MSKSGKQASEKALAAPQSPSVYDFLYCDTRRIGSFLAQFDDAGHLEKVVQRESASKNAKRGYKLGLGGGATVLGTGGQGTAAFEISPESGGSEASERVYDPLWANALTLLDYLEDNELLNRKPVTARIGQFVLASGGFAIFDLSFLKIAWEHPYLRKLALSGMETTTPEPQGNRKERRAQSKSQSKQPDDNPGEAIIDLIRVMPHGISAAVSGDGAKVWCNLSHENLVGNSADILLKHGAVIPGQWNVVGILDAIPDTDEDSDFMSRASIEHFLRVSALGAMGELIMGFAPTIRKMLGRPADAYGVTPLLIFRKVDG